MPKTTCPHCGKEVNIIPFGYRYIAVCCHQIIYNSKNMPNESEKVDLSGSIIDSIIPKEEK